MLRLGIKTRVILSLQTLKREKCSALGPELWAKVNRVRCPHITLFGARSSLARPEGICFSPDGKLLAVTNSSGGSVSFFSRLQSDPTLFEPKPTQIIHTPQLMRFPHAAAFSPCGDVLAVACRDNHAIAFYAKKTPGPDRFETAPRWTLRGENSGIHFPAGLAFHPGGHWLAVANRGTGPGFSVFSFRSAAGVFEIGPGPIQRISEAELARYGLAVPHDVLVSADGKMLIAIHERFYGNPAYSGQSGIAAFAFRSVGLDSGKPPLLSIKSGNASLHSVAEDRYWGHLAVTDGRDMVEIHRWSPAKERLVQIGKLRVCRGWGLSGAKGVAFTDGSDALVVSTELNQLLFFRIWREMLET